MIGLEPPEGADARVPVLLAARPERYLRRMPGRETFVWPSSAIDLPSPSLGAESDSGANRGRMIVKRHRASAGRAWLDRLRGRHAGSPGRREYEALAELSAAGLPVPRPLSWCARDGWSAVAMELVEHRETLRGALARARGTETRQLVEELADVVARLHGQGWYHRDLYLEHVVVRRERHRDGAASGRLCLIDLGRARREVAPRRRWFVKDLAALLHSAPPELEPAARLRFFARYLRLRGVRDRAEARGWARAVERKRARLAGHRPRHGEDIPEHIAAERELRG